MPEIDIPLTDSENLVSRTISVFNSEINGVNLIFKEVDSSMRMLMSAIPLNDNTALSTENVVAAMEKYGIRHIVTEHIDFVVKELAAGNSPENVVVAEGKEPVKGKNGEVVFKKLISTHKPRYEKDENGNIDYSDLHLFENVYTGDLVAQTVPALTGEDGEDIYGRALVSEKGENLTADEIPLPGEGIEIREKDGLFYYLAKTDGRLLFEANTISISFEYIIAGDVDYSIGSIDFVGNVTIRGDIQPNFSVKAGGNILVKGNVSQTVLDSGGSIELQCGITGGKNGKIFARGSIRSRYVDEAYIECYGDILVKNGIVSSEVMSSGRVVVDSGNIVGGTTTALKGIEAKTLGTEATVKTRVRVGVCYRAERQLKEIHKDYDVIHKELVTLSKKLEPYLKNPKVMLSLPEKERGNVKKNILRMKELHEPHEQMRLEIEAIEADVKKRSDPMLSAKATLDKGVSISFGGSYFDCEHVASPVTLLQNSRTGKPRFITYHQLGSISAAKLEADYAAMDAKRESMQ